MSDVTLGNLITGEAERDAIHVAVVPLVAGETLRVGEKFRLAHGSTEVAMRGDYEVDGNNPPIGIVDPFLDGYHVTEGQRFWGMLFQNTVTGMRHHWQNPSFENISLSTNIHEQWIREFCDRWNFSFDELIENAGSNEEWRYVTAMGSDLHSASELGEGEEALFWHHFQGYTGKIFDEDARAGLGWSCSC